MTKEVTIDATFKTNNARMELFTVFIELHRTGISTAYLFVEKRTLDGSKLAGTVRERLDKFLRPYSNQG